MIVQCIRAFVGWVIEVNGCEYFEECNADRLVPYSYLILMIKCGFWNDRLD